MSILKFLPLRQKFATTVVADLDEIVSQPVAFRFQGKIFELKPVDMETFLNLAQALTEIQGMLDQRAKGEAVLENGIYDAYFKFVSPLCPKIRIQDLRSMQLPQIHGLIHLIIRHLTGRTQEDVLEKLQTEKKKMT